MTLSRRIGVGRVEQQRLDCRASPFRSRRKLRQAATVAVGCEYRRARHGGGQRQGFASGTCAEIHDSLAIVSRAGKRDQLAALILDLDKPGSESRMIVNASICWKTNAPRTRWRWRPSPELVQQIIARGSCGVDPQIERSAFDQRGPVIGTNKWRQLRNEPFRDGTRLSANFIATDGLRASRFAEQLENRRFIYGQAQQGGAPVVRAFARAPDRAEYQLADRAPVL